MGEGNQFCINNGGDLKEAVGRGIIGKIGYIFKRLLLTNGLTERYQRYMAAFYTDLPTTLVSFNQPLVGSARLPRTTPVSLVRASQHAHI